MWIAQQREGFVYVGGIQGKTVPILVAHLKQAGIAPPTKVTAETLGIMDNSADTQGPQGLRFDGANASKIQPLLNSFKQ